MALVDVRGFGLDAPGAIQNALGNALLRSRQMTLAAKENVESEQDRQALALQQRAAGLEPQTPIAGEKQPLTQQQAIARMSIQFPERFEAISKSMGMDTQQKKEEAADFAYQLKNTPFDKRQELINARITNLSSQGRDPKDTASLLGMDETQQNQALDVVQMLPLSPQERLNIARRLEMPAGVRQFEAFTEGLTPEEKEQARRIELGLEPRATARTAMREGEITLAQETAKLQAKLKLEPGVASAVVAAKNDADIAYKIKEEERSNELAFSIYQAAIDGLSNSMGGTETGPIVGNMPAITSNQQIAEGALAAMAPVLKGIFRAAGEGTFTKDDQEILMAMLPTRKDSPSARASKLANVDAIVRMKLGQPPADQQTAPQSQAPGMQQAQPATAPQIKFMGFE